MPQLDPPKGVLLLGVQGCGKSLAARAAAGVFGVPLLRLDFGAALQQVARRVGAQPARRAAKTAELMAPCVLWIDEIEKGLGRPASGDSGTSRARARHVPDLDGREDARRSSWWRPPTTSSALPPELLRKGRFDEIFFVDLPERAVRGEILRDPLRAARAAIWSAADLDRLVAASEGFSGAELEQAVVSALYNAHATSQRPSARHVLREIQRNAPAQQGDGRAHR